MALDTEWAYAAGVIDSDGYIAMQHQTPANRPNPYYRVSVRVIQTDLRVLDWFKEIFSGNIYLQNHSRGNRKECWAWQKRDTPADEFLKGILPYLVYKKDQAELCLEFLGYKQRNKRCEISVDTELGYCNKLKELHQRRKIK